MAEPISKMAENYAKKVHAGTWQMKDVPALWRKQAQAILKKLQQAESATE